MNLSQNFTQAELIKSAAALRLNIDNQPGLPEHMNLRRLCNNILQPVRDYYGIPFVPSSGYRCLEVNRAVGSNDGSQHILGQAADIEIPGIANIDLAGWIKENLVFDQLILEFYKEGDPHSGWVHCSYADGENRNQSLIYDGKNYSKL